MRLIDVHKLDILGHLEEFPECESDKAWNAAVREISAYVDLAPAVDAVPIVHGQWEFLGPNRLNKECMCGTCSVCKVRSKYIVNTALCPNCGAQMCNADYGGRAGTAGGVL